MDFEEALGIYVNRMGPIRLYTIRNNVTRAVEEIAETLRVLEEKGVIEKVITLQPDPIEFYASPEDARRLRDYREDRTLRILTQSDPYCSRFIQEIRLFFVMAGIDLCSKVLTQSVEFHVQGQ